jgi:hypothetical protein
MSSPLDKILELTRLADANEITAAYDEVCSGQQLHLLDHVKATALPEGDALSLEHQVPYLKIHTVRHGYFLVEAFLILS